MQSVSNYASILAGGPESLSFLRLKSIPLHVQTISCSHTHLLMATCSASTSGLLWIMLWICMVCKYLFESLLFKNWFEREKEGREGWKEREREKPWHIGVMHKPTMLASQGESLLSFLWGVYPDIAGSYGNYIFHFLKNHYIIFHSNYTILHSHQQCIRDLVSPHSHQHLLFSVILCVCIL